MLRVKVYLGRDLPVNFEVSLTLSIKCESGGASLDAVKSDRAPPGYHRPRREGLWITLRRISVQLRIVRRSRVLDRAE